MNNLMKLPTEEKPQARLLLKGKQGILITLNADGTAASSTHMGVMFTWTYIGARLELRTVIDAMTVDLAMSFDDLDELA